MTSRRSSIGFCTRSLAPGSQQRRLVARIVVAGHHQYRQPALAVAVFVADARQQIAARQFALQVDIGQHHVRTHAAGRPGGLEQDQRVLDTDHVPHRQPVLLEHPPGGQRDHTAVLDIQHLATRLSLRLHIAANELGQGAEAERLVEIVGDVLAQRTCMQAFVDVARNHHDRHIGLRRVHPHAARQLKPVHVGQAAARS